jgi:hypothetical protein
MRYTLTVLLVAGGLALTACGGKSTADKAMAQVCSSRNDLQAQVTKLSKLTPMTATTATVGKSIVAIEGDLTHIGAQVPKLDSKRRHQVESAALGFESRTRAIASQVGTSPKALTTAQLQAALSQLKSGYDQTFGKLSC